MGMRRSRAEAKVALRVVAGIASDRDYESMRDRSYEESVPEYENRCRQQACEVLFDVLDQLGCRD